MKLLSRLIKHSGLFIFLLFAALGSRAQQATNEAYIFSLKQAIDYALAHQNSVINAQIDEEIAKNKVKETIGIGLPQVNASFSLQDFLKIPTTLLPGELINKPGTQVPVQFGVKYQSTAGIDASQLLFDGSYIVGLQASRTYKELSMRNATRTKIETAVAVTQAYYGVLVNNEKITLLDANLVRLKKSLNDSEQMFKNGFVEGIDVDRLKVLLNNLETEKANAMRLLDLNVNMLKFQMGMPINKQLSLTDKIASINLDKTDINRNDTTAYANRIEYSLLQTQKKLNELDLKRYRSQILPTVSATGSYSWSFQNNQFGSLFNTDYPSSIIGLRVAWPIFTGGQRTYKIRSARLVVKKSENDLMNSKNAIAMEVNQTQTVYTNSLQALDNQKRNMNLAQEVLRVTKVKYDQGVGSSLEVTTAETSLKEAQNNYISALYDVLISKVNLDKALGNIKY